MALIIWLAYFLMVYLVALTVYCVRGMCCSLFSSAPLFSFQVSRSTQFFSSLSFTFTDMPAKPKQNADGRARAIPSGRGSLSGGRSASPAACGSGSGHLGSAGAAVGEVVVVVVVVVAVVSGLTDGGLHRRWEDW